MDRPARPSRRSGGSRRASARRRRRRPAASSRSSASTRRAGATSASTSQLHSRPATRRTRPIRWSGAGLAHRDEVVGQRRVRAERQGDAAAGVEQVRPGALGEHDRQGDLDQARGPSRRGSMRSRSGDDGLRLGARDAGEARRPVGELERPAPGGVGRAGGRVEGAGAKRDHRAQDRPAAGSLGGCSRWCCDARARRRPPRWRRPTLPDPRARRGRDPAGGGGLRRLPHRPAALRGRPRGPAPADRSRPPGRRPGRRRRRGRDAAGARATAPAPTGWRAPTAPAATAGPGARTSASAAAFTGWDRDGGFAERDAGAGRLRRAAARRASTTRRWRRCCAAA